MGLTKKLAALATGTVMAATLGVVAAPQAQAAEPGSLAEVLLADGDEFDKNSKDYDIVTQAALAVIGAKPDSPVSLLTQGDVPLTAFLPDDRAFRFTVFDLTGQYLRSEEAIFGVVAGLGIDAVEKVLLYHVYAEGAVDSATAVTLDGAEITMASGETLGIDVLSARAALVRLVDQDTNDFDAWLDRSDLDIRAGAQIAHGINFAVLRFADDFGL